MPTEKHKRRRFPKETEHLLDTFQNWFVNRTHLHVFNRSRSSFCLKQSNTSIYTYNHMYIYSTLYTLWWNIYSNYEYIYIYIIIWYHIPDHPWCWYMNPYIETPSMTQFCRDSYTSTMDMYNIYAILYMYRFPQLQNLHLGPLVWRYISHHPSIQI